MTDEPRAREDRAEMIKGLLIGAGVVGLVFVVIYSATRKTPASATQPALVIAPTGNYASDQLAALAPSSRVALLAAIVNDRCSGTDAFYMGSSGDRQAFWSVRCANGRSYQVTVEANATGSSSVMDCAVLKAVADVDCFTRLSDQEGRKPRTRSQMKADIDNLPPESRREALENFSRNLKRVR